MIFITKRLQVNGIKHNIWAYTADIRDLHIWALTDTDITKLKQTDLARELQSQLLERRAPLKKLFHHKSSFIDLSHSAVMLDSCYCVFPDM